MANSNRSTKDKEMAARLKKLGIQRDTGRCPVCYKYPVKNGTHPGVRCLEGYNKE